MGRTKTILDTKKHNNAGNLLLPTDQIIAALAVAKIHMPTVIACTFGPTMAIPALIKSRKKSPYG
jgi:hypothetical protein